MEVALEEMCQRATFLVQWDKSLSSVFKLGTQDLQDKDIFLNVLPAQN